jgi:predicted Zn-dependent protease
MQFASIKRLFLIAVFIYVSQYLINNVAAGPKLNFGNFDYRWHSTDCIEIGFLNPQKDFTISYSIDDDCEIPGGSIENLEQLIEDSATSWCENYNLEFKISNQNINQSLINFSIISRNSFLKKQFSDPVNLRDTFDRKSVIGLVNRDNFEYVGYGELNENNIDVYQINKTTIYIVWDNEKKSDYKTSYYTYEKWLKLFTHEFGHAMGYRGHNKNDESNPIMFDDGSKLMSWDVFKPNENDIEHLKNIYTSPEYLKIKNDLN